MNHGSDRTLDQLLRRSPRGHGKRSPERVEAMLLREFRRPQGANGWRAAAAAALIVVSVVALRPALLRRRPSTRR